MTVLNFAVTEVNDIEKMQLYIAAAAPLMKQYAVEVVARGQYLKTLLGGGRKPHITAILRFPDMITAEKFYKSAAYIALLSLREQAGVMTFDFYEE